jgi:predicted RNA methylase
MSTAKRHVRRGKKTAVPVLPQREARPTTIREDATTFKPKQGEPIFCAGIDYHTFASKQGSDLRGFTSRTGKFISGQTEIAIPSQDGVQLQFDIADPRREKERTSRRKQQ